MSMEPGVITKRLVKLGRKLHRNWHGLPAMDRIEKRLLECEADLQLLLSGGREGEDVPKAPEVKKKRGGRAAPERKKAAPKRKRGFGS